MKQRDQDALAQRLAKVACDFFHYGFDPDNPRHQTKLAEEWIAPELDEALKKEKKSKSKIASGVPKEYKRVARSCPHHVPCADPWGCSGHELVPLSDPREDVDKIYERMRAKL